MFYKTNKHKLSMLVSIILILALALCACGGDSDASEKNDADQTVASAEQNASSNNDSGDKNDGSTEDESKDESSKSGDSSKDTSSNSTKSSGSSGNSSGSSGSSSSSSSGSNSGSKSSSGGSKSSDNINCTIAIDCKSAVSKHSDKTDKVSNNGVILSTKKLTLKKGATVYDALKASGISFTGKSYISTINGLSEKECGGSSGWKYYVNGSAPMTSNNKYVLKDGDSIQWKYVL